MKEILKKYYTLEIDEYREYNDGIIFMVDGVNYYFVRTTFDEDYIKMLFDLQRELASRVKLHDFVFNTEMKLLSEGCVLLKVNVLVDEIDLQDIKVFSGIVNNELLEDYVKMDTFWGNKIDYLETQLSELSDNKLINNSFDYYVGISEVLLAYLKKIDFEKVNLCLTHRVFYTLSTLDYYNPLNVTFDVALRDYASYIRILGDQELIINLLDNYKFNKYEYNYFFVRLVFPFEYFHLVSDLLLDNKNEDKLVDLINNNLKYENYIWYLQKLFGIYIFDWLKKE